MTRVLSTNEATAAIVQLQSILSGDLESTIKKLDAQGRQLSDPNVWDGPLASEFRSNVWPAVSQSLEQTRMRLDDLRGRLDRINRDIIQAGGGS